MLVSAYYYVRVPLCLNMCLYLLININLTYKYAYIHARLHTHIHIQVEPAGCSNALLDTKLPTCRTCVNYLYLPNYSSPAVLQERLGVAMWEEHIAFD